MPSHIRVKHINTGCFYDEHGQEITIVYEDGKTHFLDHSRMVDGTINEPDLKPMQVINKYLYSEYDHCSLSWDVRREMRQKRREFNFVDYSGEYRWLITR